MNFFSFPKTPTCGVKRAVSPRMLGRAKLAKLAKTKKTGGMGQFCLIDAKTYGELIDSFFCGFWGYQC